MTPEELKKLKYDALDAAIKYKDVDTLVHMFTKIPKALSIVDLVNIVKQGDDKLSNDICEAIPGNTDMMKRTLSNLLPPDDDPFLHDRLIQTMRQANEVPSGMSDRDVRIVINKFMKTDEYRNSDSYGDWRKLLADKLKELKA